jgi:hypothetical protein
VVIMSVAACLCQRHLNTDPGAAWRRTGSSDLRPDRIAAARTHADVSELRRHILMRRMACSFVIHAASPCSCNGSSRCNSAFGGSQIDALMFVNPRGRPVLPGLTCGLPRRRLWPPLAAPPGRSSSLRCGRWTCGFAGGDVAATGECRACHRRPAQGGGGAKGRRATWRRRSGIGGRSGAVPLRGWWPGPGRSGPSCGR